MSENKISDTLEFDDDIDFEGLDECNEESDDSADDKSESFDDELTEETKNDAYNVSYEQEQNNIVHNETKYEKEIFSVDERILETKKTDKFVRGVSVFNAVISVVTLGALGLGIYFGKNYIDSLKNEINEQSAEITQLEEKNNNLEAEYIEAMNVIEKQSEVTSEIVETDIERSKILLYDSSVGYSWIPVISGIEKNTYNKDNFTVDDRFRMSYTVDEEVSSYFGIDVSSYQGDIDWQLVKEDGVEFAFLRIGYRGYGEEGKLCPDEFFKQNYEAAHDAGIDLGVYFFSQATSVAEATEEAEYVLSLLENRTLEYPIVFDWENIYTGDPEDIPRTDDVMPQTLTLSAIAFCETIKDAGYDAMIYTNKKLATIKYDLRQLRDYPVWLAYYNTELDYYYDFDIWQYGTGQVDGIEGEVDVNIAIIR